MHERIEQWGTAYELPPPPSAVRRLFHRSCAFLRHALGTPGIGSSWERFRLPRRTHWPRGARGRCIVAPGLILHDDASPLRRNCAQGFPGRVIFSIAAAARVLRVMSSYRAITICIGETSYPPRARPPRRLRRDRFNLTRLHRRPQLVRELPHPPLVVDAAVVAGDYVKIVEAHQ